MTSTLSDSERRECVQIGEQFKNVRLRVNLSQAEAAKKCNLSGWQPAQIEAGKCGVANIKKVMNAIVVMEDMNRNKKKPKTQPKVITESRPRKELTLPGVMITKQEGFLATALTGDECFQIPERFAMIESTPEGWKMYPLKASTIDPRVEALERDNARLKLMLAEANEFKNTARSFFAQLDSSAPKLLTVTDAEVVEKAPVLSEV